MWMYERKGEGKEKGTFWYKLWIEEGKGIYKEKVRDKERCAMRNGEG
jgi:hypothetical protein